MSDKTAPKQELMPKNKGGRPKGSTLAKKLNILEIIQRKVYERYGLENWHPIVEMALYAADPTRMVVARDNEGQIIYDKNDHPIILEMIDPGIRQKCLEQLANYVAPKLKSVELTPAAMGERFTLNYNVTVEGETWDDMEGSKGDD